MSDIVIFAYGSRGDVQPPVNLGGELASRGHRVRVLAPGRYENLVTAAGLGLEPLRLDPIAVLASPDGQRWQASRDPVSFALGFRRVVRPLLDQVLDDAAAAGQGADLILAPAMGGAGCHVAERVGARSLVIHLQPGERTAAFCDPVIGAGRRLGPMLNLASHVAFERLSWAIFGPSVRPWREQRLGLPPLPRGGVARWVRSVTAGAALGGFSPSVVGPEPEWRGVLDVTGYWFSPLAPAPSPELRAFVDAGPPPVYVGFGSLVPAAGPAALIQAVAEALQRLRLRGVMLVPNGPGGAADPMARVGELAGSQLFLVDEAPHSWLFPRCAALVHHGGAGTTAEGVRAGVPQVICPGSADQAFWARTLVRHSVAPPALPIGRVSAESLIARLESALSPGPIRAALALAEQVRAEAGVTTAADAVERALAAPVRPAGRGDQVSESS